MSVASFVYIMDLILSRILVLERWTFCQYIGFWRLATKTDHQRGERGGWVDKWAIDGWYSLDVLNCFTFSTLAMLTVTTYAAHQNNVKVVRWRSGRLIWTDVLINWIVSLFSRLREINKIMSREPMSWIVSLFSTLMADYEHFLQCDTCSNYGYLWVSETIVGWLG